MKRLLPGDLIEFNRTCIYCHWAIYEGEGKIIHYSGEVNSKKGAKVERAELYKVANGSPIRINNESDVYYPPLIDTVKRAQTRLTNSSARLSVECTIYSLISPVRT
uniref:LRAT domain-containing protein n=1 Tax=Acrobeloides nanus TaxID=290746 RepID=A0A914BW17_9BILA